VQYDKPFLDFKDLLLHVHDKHNLELGNEDFALTALVSMTYYDLINGYKDCFMVDDNYTDNVSVEYLYQFSLFDKSFQSILFKYSVYIERIFKNALAYSLAKNFSVDEHIYLDPSKYVYSNSPGRVQKFKDTMADIVDVYTKAECDQPTLHYKTHKNHIPPWILFKNVNFSTSIDLYSFLMKREKDVVVNMIIKKNIPNSYKHELIKTSLTIIRKFRNKIAHNSIFVSHRLNESLIIKNLMSEFGGTLLTSDEVSNHIGESDPYSMVLSLILLQPDSFLVNQFVKDILALVNEYRSTPQLNIILTKYCEITSIPQDIDQRLIKYIARINKQSINGG
jgi:abortive infection bacteriophage resistance protein